MNGERKTVKEKRGKRRKERDRGTGNRARETKKEGGRENGGWRGRTEGRDRGISLE